MKHAFKSIVAAAIAAFALAGCKSIPTPEQMKATATAIGVAAGLVADETKISEKARNTVVAIVEEVSRATPAVGQTFEEAWTPVAQSLVDKYVAEGKIDAATGQIAMTAFAFVVKGIDYIFTVRYPKARQYEELVAAAIAGFTDGFLTVFKPINEKSAVTEAKPPAVPDPDALLWLRSKAKK